MKYRTPAVPPVVVIIDVDVAGDYEVQLRVTNDVGLTSAPAICRFESIPANQVHIELYWDEADADLDLHLVARGPRAGAHPSSPSRRPPW